MHFEFETNPTGGLRVIEEIQDYRLCWLEGRNGIGKTLAVRLLELATGEQPYAANDNAWQSLRDHLHTTNIRITGLRNGAQLELQLTPDTWPDEPITNLALLGRAWLNGADLDFRRVPNILRVSRIGGDETITTRFRDRIAADEILISRRSQQVSDAIDRLEAWNEKLLYETDGLSSLALSELEARRLKADRDRLDAAQENERKKALVRRLETLRSLEADLQDLEVRGPKLDEALSAIDKKISNNDRQRAESEKVQRELARDVYRAQELIETLQQLRQRRESQAERAQDTLAEATGALERLGLLPDAETIRSALEQARAERYELLRERAALAMFPDLMELIDDLIEPLRGAQGSSLDDEAIALLDERRASASELRSGLVRRRRELSEQQQYSLVEDIDARMRAVEVRIEAIIEANELRKTANRRFGQLGHTENRIHETSERLLAVGGDNYRQAVLELQDLQEERQRLLEEQAELRYQKRLLERAGSIASLQQEISALREELSVNGNLGHELQRARDEADAAYLHLQRCAETVTTIDAELVNFNRRLKDTVETWESSPDYHWLRVSIGERLPSLRLDRAEQLSRVEKTTNAIQRLQQASDELRIANEAVGGALSTLANLIGTSQVAKGRYVDALVTFYEEEFGDLLAANEIRHALFEGGQFTRLDLLRGEVSWTTRNREPRRRPIEAFSSGERAFTYVLASLLQRTSEPTDNRVLVLDEFGAFIEAGRLGRLLRFVDEEVLKPDRAEQVVIILPLRQQLNAAHSNYGREEIQAVEERGYFMRSMST
jgi:hypothetical protein